MKAAQSHDPHQTTVKIRLSTKLTAFTTLILTLAVITLGLIAINLGAAALTSESSTQEEAFVTEGAGHIGAIVSGNLGKLDEIALRARTATMDWNTQVASIAGDVERLGYQDIAVMDMNGNARYIIGGGEFKSEGQFWYEDGFAGNTSISDVAISKVTNEPVVFEVAPIKNNGQVVGLLVGRRDPTFMLDITNAMGDGERKYGMVINENGAVMAHPNEQLILDQTNVFDEIEANGPLKEFGLAIQELGTGQTGSIAYNYKGDQKLAYNAPIPGTNWTLIVTKFEDDVLAPINHLRNVILIAALIILLAGGVATFILARKISNPIVSLNQMIKEMTQGHLSDRLEVASRDEVGEMTSSMNQLADDLQNVVIATMNQISNGDVSADIELRDSRDEIAPALKLTIETIRGLISESTMLSQAAIAGQWETRGDADAFKGGFREIVQGVNATLDTVVDQMVWYEAIIDAIPFPLHVTDNDMKWTFMNKPFEDLMIANGVIKDRNSACGMDCYNANADICRTEGCGIRRLVDQGLTDSYFEWVGRSNKQDTAYLKNKKGENIGFVEVVTDLTPIIRVSDYTKNEVTRLENNLSSLAQGDLNFDINVGEPDEYTAEVSIQFHKIGDTLAEVKQSVGNLIDDASMLAQAGIDGKLSTRADASRHQGDFAKIVNGVNATLDAVVAPVKEASDTLQDLAKGNLNTGMVGNYNGDYTRIKNDMNQTVAFLKNYVDEIAKTLLEMGQGNLDIEITTDYLGDFQAIKTGLNGIAATLSETMSEINEAAGQVEAGARQISDGGQALSQGTTEQASAIQQLNASIEEVAGETKKNATNANEANERALEVRSNAEVGNEQMTKMVSAMIDINESSKSISKIIKVIDDIAFQTNILALNAAVEAARAGSHGKGFAVVAEEVRSLAARSAEAAKETTGLIEGSIDKVEAGTRIADETAASLVEILNEIEKVTGLVGNIARASNDQATEIAQITQGIEQVSTVVQTNSATAEESAAASEELSGQAEMLKQMVGAFKLKKKGAAHHTSPRPPVEKPVKQKDTAETSPQIVLDDLEMDKY
ncbi:methyl-accepting chemotaxis protein [Acetobacterium wieringae]|uniref:Methyl-accepting chemotaxis protein IV n=1 Tax=Acetobacterium wieringae TaxID=52694 RepID=A0A1F2PII5_9FIRM|nr:methyl-accepting chemotaxis protein [Acetobacterium wieringae]OFV70526.1 methyl-accepting chemotaxis protein IV [Acetobacterium wieringae]